MEEGQVSVDGVSRPLPRPFLVAATQNPVEYEGTYPLPEAQLDRFLLKVVLPIPDRARRAGDPAPARGRLRPARRGRGRGHGRWPAPTTSPPAARPSGGCRSAPRSPATSSTSPARPGESPSLSLGVSPRGATALLRSARAWAWLTGRDFVTPDDVKALAHATLVHRLGLRPEAELEGVDVAQVLAVRAGLGAGPALRCTVAISGRVPLLLLLGLVPVVLRPSMGTVWLWLLAVGAARRGRPAAARPAPGARSTLERPTVGTGAARGSRPRPDCWSPTPRRADAARRPARRVAAHRRRHRQPAPARARRRATGSCSALRCSPAGAATCRPTGRHRATPRAPRPGRAPAHPGRRGRGARRCRRSTSRKHLPSRLARLRDLDGRAAVRVRGQGTEFDSLREYVRGDDVRSIDWRASARNRNVVVRTWQPERDRRVVLVLDTSRTSAGRVGDVPRLDSAMDAALLLAALAARAGDRVDFVAGDRRVRSPAALRRGARRRGRPPGRDGRPRTGDRRGRLDLAGRRGHRLRPPARARRPAHPAGALGRRGGPAAGAADAHPAPPRRPRLGARPRARRSWPRSATTLDEVYDAAAAEQVLARRRHTAGLLRALGVDVVDADAEQLPPALADHYLGLKARGLL